MSSDRQQVSGTEMGALLFMFLFGSSFTLPMAAVAKHDAWLSILLALAAGTCLAWLYAHLCQSYPGRTIIEITEQLLGKWTGKGIGLLYAWYSFHLGVLVLKNFTVLISSVGLTKTPTFVSALPLLAIMLWVTIQGLDVLGRCAVVLLAFIVLEIVVSVILLSPDFHFEYLLPLFDQGWPPVVKGALESTSFPFGETVLFAFVLPKLSTPSRAVKTTVGFTLAAGLLLWIGQTRNLLVLGDLVSNLIYPTYSAYQYVSIADFIERIEPMVFMTEVTSVFVKLSICFYVTTLALSQVFQTEERHRAVYYAPIALLILEMNFFIYKNSADMYQFSEIWPYYSMPVQVLIPLLLWAVMRIKRRTSAQTSDPHGKTPDQTRRPADGTGDL